MKWHMAHFKYISLLISLNIIIYLSFVNGAYAGLTKRETPKLAQFENEIDNAPQEFFEYKNEQNLATRREKRQSELDMELMDLEKPAQKAEDEPEEEGFWSRVARVCLNLLKRFFTWINE